MKDCTRTSRPTLTAATTSAAGTAASTIRLTRRIGRLLALAAVALAVSLVAPATTWAQTATSSSQQGGNSASLAIDGNTDTRWESQYSNQQWWKLDNGTQVTFNTITILWEGAYGKAFKILATNDAAVGNAATVVANQWDELVSVTGNTAGHQVRQSFRLNAAKSYRYVCFYGTERATGYGYSFYEFKLGNDPSSAEAGTNNADAVKAIDDNLHTYWTSGSMAEDGAVTFTIDYATARTFDILGIVWRGKEASNAAYDAKHVLIEASNDTKKNKTWTTLVETNPSYENGQNKTTDNANHFCEGFPIGHEVSYRYVRITLSKPSSPANGCQICEIFTDHIQAFRLNSVSHRKGVELPDLTATGSDQVLKGEYRELKAYVDGIDHKDIDVNGRNATRYTQDDAGAIGTFAPATRRLTGKAGGEVTLTAHLMPYGATGAASTSPAHTAAMAYTVVDAAALTLVHTHGADDPENMHPEAWGAWTGGASAIDTEYLVPATGPDDTNPHADSRIRNGVRQQTHVTEHLIYALPGETIYLTPYTDFRDAGQYEEKLLRWYDYRTDNHHDWLTLYANDAEPNVQHTPYGIITGTAIGCTNRQWGTVAKLTIPTDVPFHEEPVIIAVDASQDPADVFRNEGKYMEPLINFRHLFIIYDAREHVADYSHSVEQNIHFTQVRKRHITARAGVDFQVRLNYMMPVNTGHASGMLYESDTEDDPTYPVADGETHGKNYRVGPSYVRTFDTNGNEIPDMFRLDKPSKPTYECAEYYQPFNRMIVCDAANAAPGTYTVRLYASDLEGNPVYVRGSGKSVLLIAQEYEVKFVGSEVASFFNEEELASHAASIGHQQYSYLDEHYRKIATVDYEDYSLTEPALIDVTNASGVRYKWPVDWWKSNYAFGYHERHDYNMYMLATHSDLTPYHDGANRWPKEKNFPGSPCYNPGTTGSGGGLYDRRYYETQGQEKGYFYYVNAAGDPGVMARVPIDELCLGSTLFVTGWVAEFSDTNEKANVIFNFNVILKNGRTVTLHSFTSGYIPTAPGANKSPDQIYCGRWYKSYYSFVPHALDVDPALIDHYELTLENNCINSDGADYAVDDIRVWVSKPEVLAQQLTPLCHGERETEVKVSTRFESLLATIGQTPAVNAAMGKDYNLFYTLLDKEKYDAAYAAEPDPALKQQAALDAAIVSYQYEDFGDGTPSADPMYKDEPYKSHQRYGVLSFNSFFTNNTQEYVPGIIGSNHAMRETVQGIDYLVFNTMPHTDDLAPGREYMIALWSPVNSSGELADYENCERDVLVASNFDIGDLCAKVGYFTVLSAGVLKINGEIVSSRDHLTVCRNQYPVIQIDVQGMVPVDPATYDPADPSKSERKMTVVEENAPYDWFFGSHDEYYAAHYEEGGTTLFTLDEAIHCYREYYNGEAPGDDDIALAQPHLASSPGHHYDASHQPILFTQAMLDYLRALASTPVAALSGRPALLLYKRACPISPRIVNGAVEYKVTAVPIQRSKYWVDYEGNLVELGPDKVLVCTDPTEVHVRVDNSGPVLKHGFAHDMAYPADLDDVPLRIGYDQLRLVSLPSAELRKVALGQRAEQDVILHDAVLTVPVRAAGSVNAEVTTLSRAADAVVYLYETNDPEYAQLQRSQAPIVPYPDEKADDNVFLPQVGLLLYLDGATDEATIRADRDFFRLVFRDDFRFKEGYYYSLRLSYQEDYPAGYTGDRTECDGQTVMTLKVVPKYQMWVGGTSTDYNNDRNWRRVTAGELHHSLTPDDALADKLTDGHASSLDAADAGYANQLSYVPMDFTDVLIPDTDRFPRLYCDAAQMVSLSYAIHVTDDTTPLSCTWLWPEGDGDDRNGDGTSGLNSGATPDVQYDMAAWTRRDGDHTPLGVYCRPWYANTCEHITFLAGAEMFGQQHLNYQRAWVELELAPDRWYTLTSPLKRTVAGDMYLPSDRTDVPGRQVSEHFQPITYSNDRNDRFRPAVYQRAWDHSGMARIYRRDTDGMYGDGRLDDACVAGTWSHVYNDNEEIFTDGRGFSIRTDISRLPAAQQPDKVLFRLPKDDTSYSYHNSVAPGTQGATDATGATTGGHYEGDRADINRTVGNDPVFAEGIPHQARLNDVSGEIRVTNGGAGRYFLVGNPFMASLDMQRFFDENADVIRPKYWVVTDGRQDVAIMGDANTTVGTAGSSVAPMQAFFVEAADGSSNTITLRYDASMQRDFPLNGSVDDDGSNLPGTANPNLRPGDTRPSLKAPASRSVEAPEGQLRIMLHDASEPVSRADHSPRLVSTAVVALSPMSSCGYDAAEDAILLLDSNLATQPSVYTVADGTAVSINSLDRVDTVPLGMYCPDDEASAKLLTLSFSGADTFPQPLYLHDAESGTVTPIEDGLQVNVPASAAGRYFITTSIDHPDTHAISHGPAYDLRGIRAARTDAPQILLTRGRKSYGR